MEESKEALLSESLSNEWIRLYPQDVSVHVAAQASLNSTGRGEDMADYAHPRELSRSRYNNNVGTAFLASSLTCSWFNHVFHAAPFAPVSTMSNLTEACQYLSGLVPDPEVGLLDVLFVEIWNQSELNAHLKQSVQDSVDGLDSALITNDVYGRESDLITNETFSWIADKARNLLGVFQCDNGELLFDMCSRCPVTQYAIRLGAFLAVMHSSASYILTTEPLTIRYCIGLIFYAMQSMAKMVSPEENITIWL